MGLSKPPPAWPTFPPAAIAPESDITGIEIRQQIHGRRSGRYRVLFVIRDDVVHVIHILDGARDVMQPDDIELPPRDVS